MAKNKDKYEARETALPMQSRMDRRVPGCSGIDVAKDQVIVPVAGSDDNTRCCSRLKRNLSCLNVALLCLIIGALILFYARPEIGLRSVESPSGDNPSGDSPSGESMKVVDLLGTALSKGHLNVGMRNDYLLQACGEPQLKQSFPDVDYAFFGYNILKGYPLAAGHDPGFTLPIFQADYSAGSQSADCRYSIPKGVTIVPDVSCVTSFSSEIIKTQEAFSSSLSVSVGVQGSGWGVSFSASVGYNSAKSGLENREKVYVLSTANCKYYFSKLVATDIPQFTPSFLQWIRRLESSPDENTYLEFFETYGTHFPVETTFGARYTYEHSMTTAEFERKEKQGFDVAMSASYSGLFSAGASFGLSSEQERMASSFSQNVKTKTVTVGAAPPADGDAMKWASAVQLNPVPVYYKLSSIENLFTAKYMKGMNINYEPINRYIIRYKTKYPERFVRNALIEGCKSREEKYVLLQNKKITYPEPSYTGYGRLSDCLDECFNDEDCNALTYSAPEKKCFYYKISTTFGTASGFTTYEFRKNNFHALTWTSSELSGGLPFRESVNVTLSDCELICQNHAYCYALTSYMNTCKLYRRNDITTTIHRNGATTKFVSKCGNVK